MVFRGKTTALDIHIGVWPSYQFKIEDFCFNFKNKDSGDKFNSKVKVGRSYNIV